MDMGCIRAISSIDSLCLIRFVWVGVDRFNISKMIVMIVGWSWLVDGIGLIFPIKGVFA